MKVQQPRSLKRHEALIKTAAKLFLKRGYDGVTVEQIVHGAGGSNSTVYNAFGGKCGLFITSVERLCADINTPMRGLDYSGLNLQQSLEKFGCALVAMVTRKENVALYRLIIAESTHCPEVGHAWYTHGPLITASLIEEILNAHPRKPAATSPSIRRAAISLQDSLTTDIQHCLLLGEKVQTDAKSIRLLVDETVQLFLHGYGAKK